MPDQRPGMTHEEQAAFLANLRTTWMGRRFHAYHEIDSTNSAIKSFADEDAPAGTVVLAQHQLRGRGRLGRTWIDTPGKNLLFSVLLRPSLPSGKMPLLTFYAAVAVGDAIAMTTGIEPECKWPNDLLMEGRKCCGILLESATDALRHRYAVIGIGLNVNQDAFPEELEGRTTSLALCTGRSVDRMDLLRAILERMEHWHGAIEQDSFQPILDAWHRRVQMFGKTVVVVQGTERFQGTALALAGDGGLVIERNGIPTTVYAGDVTLARS